MFGKLALEKYKRQATRDHTSIIKEAAGGDGIENTEDTEFSLSDLDAVISTDGDTVSQADIDSLENEIGEVADKEDTNVAQMTKAEISSHISNISTPSLLELDK